MPHRQGDIIVATASAAHAGVTGWHRRYGPAFGTVGCAVPLLAVYRYLFT